MFYNRVSAVIPNYIPAGCRAHLFADDKTFELDCLPSRISEGFDLLQKCVNGLQLWAKHRGLSFNPNKCKVVVFGPPSFFRSDAYNNLSSDIVIGDTVIEVVKEVKYLGV